MAFASEKAITFFARNSAQYNLHPLSSLCCKRSTTVHPAPKKTSALYQRVCQMLIKEAHLLMFLQVSKVDNYVKYAFNPEHAGVFLVCFKNINRAQTLTIASGLN
jgi:hypothetical protein